MDEVTIVNALTNFGFPAIVTAYLLIRQTKQLSDLTESIVQLNNSIEKNQTENRLYLELLRKERFSNVDLHKSGTQS